jgi:hypothetical protein
MAPITLTVYAAAATQPISRYIYGLNFATESFAREIDLPLRRWGGNNTTRYNWRINATNHASDWFFHNDLHYDDYTGLAETADQWIARNQLTGTESLITMPMAGFLAKNGDQRTYAFSIKKYGAQEKADDLGGFPDCGNGVLPSGAYVINDPTDTSDAADESYAASWMDHLVTNLGPAAVGGVRFIALDNEPGIWHETHRDIHPAPFTYDESFDKGRRFAEAVKAKDPDVLIFGPVQDGWTRYFYASYPSAAQANTDRDNHGDVDFVPWYLQQMSGYEQDNGVRLLDFLDLHFYPQNGVDQTLAGDSAKQALRLRSTAALWDASYVDESWIADPGALDGGIVRLIPRMRDWVNANYPGTRLALTEYNWGGLEDINGALAQADVLGIFGAEALDVAALWNYPAHKNPADEEIKYDVFENLPGACAFRMYRNYNGIGGKFGDLSVSANSADRGQLAVYGAQRTSDTALTVMVINKTGGDLDATVSIADFAPAGAADVYRYSHANLAAITHEPDQPIAAGGFSASFPANSITLFVIPSAA